MAIKNVNKENILVKVDQNNLITVDPNTVIEDGYVLGRDVKQENLVMYVNLEADLIPRTILASNKENTTLKSIARGTFNLLDNKKGRDFDTSWTDSYYDVKDVPNDGKDDIFHQSDETGQSFGMQDISIDIQANFIPQVNINFVDVRGKTLFEAPKNSPYNAFFHLPWPVFYLTVKGFYGKAIKYRLHLTDFKSSFNEKNGNFEIATTFVGSTYAYINDIPLNAIINAPYMFSREYDIKPEFNEKRGVWEKRISKTTKGYILLKAVYDEMKQKKLIPDDFPVKTVREVALIAETLDKLLEKSIFEDVVDAKVLNALVEYSKILSDFEGALQGWSNNSLSSVSRVINEKKYYGFQKNRTDNRLFGADTTGTLEYILESYKYDLNRSLNVILTAEKKAGFKSNMLSKRMGNVQTYTTTFEFKSSNGPEDVVAFYEILDDLQEIRKTFKEEKDKIERLVEVKMNEILKKKSVFGFEPTIRNLFAVITANAEVYLRLLRDTHYKAFDVGEARKGVLENYNDETNGEPIYPWPQIRRQMPGKNKHEIVYPGDPEMRSELKSHDSLFWPEVDFVEDYIRTASYQTDPLANKESSESNAQYVFTSDDEISKKTSISNLYSSKRVTPYTNMSPANFLFEIYERAKIITLEDSFTTKTLNEMAQNEFESIKLTVGDEITLTNILSKNINTYEALIDVMTGFAPFEKNEYYKDSVPTTEYMKELNNSFFLETFDKTQGSVAVTDEKYPSLKSDLETYIGEKYRQNIFPFSSDGYLSQIGRNTTDEIKFSGVEVDFKPLFSTNNMDDLITTPINSEMWVKDGFTSVFKQRLTIGDNTTNILNTPYFHKQIFSDFNKTFTYGKYSGSAYLLLNSLPFKDLDDYIDDSEQVRMSTMFKEVGATHFVPYYTLLKWGALYHRYKKYIQDGEDILDGFLNVSNITQPISGVTFFDIPTYGETTVKIYGDEVKYNDNTDVGIHPFYDAVFHQVVNGYNHYDLYDPYTSYDTNVTNGSILTTRRTAPGNNLNHWTTFVDNSKFDSTDNRYTLIPSDGFNSHINNKTETTINADTFDEVQQSNFRVIWEDEFIPDTFSGKTFFGHNEYNRTTTILPENEYTLDNNYKKVVDLMGTFKPDILDAFEDLFLNFSSLRLETEVAEKDFSNLDISNFQDLLKEIVTLDKSFVDNNDKGNTLFSAAKNTQITNLQAISDHITSVNLVKFTIGNPKEYESYILDGFSGNVTTSKLGFNDYSSAQETPENLALLDLYLGEFPDSGINFYREFFATNNIELSSDNILQLRTLIFLYAGYRKLGKSANSVDFKFYIKSNIFDVGTGPNGYSGANKRLNYFITQLIANFSKLKENEKIETINFAEGYNLRGLKIETYNNLKAFNDRWTSGNSIGQKLLLEEFLFLNKANADIGGTAFLNIDKFKDLVHPGNANVSLYGAISLLLKDSGFDMRPLPAYVNFYGSEQRSKFKATPSSTIADNLFGTFLDVDYEDSEPKIVIQLVSPSSKHMDNSSSSFKDDSFDITSPHDNPLLITAPEAFTSEVLQKSNKVVAFEVSFGDQNQSIFNGLTLDQKSLKNTSESYEVLEMLGGSTTGSNTYNVDVSLYDYYRMASYQCEVKCMGNVMIQPTMFFYLKNVPMYKGTYWITDVSHKISNNSVQTTFKGSRLPRTSLPDAEDSFISNYRPLFEKVLKKAIAFTNINDEQVGTETVINTVDGNFTIDKGIKKFKGETVIDEAGITQFGLPYNGKYGEKYIQKIKYENGDYSNKTKQKEWLRAVVCRMGSEIHPIDANTDMSILGSFRDVDTDLTEIKWEKVKDKQENIGFYSSKFLFGHGAKANDLLNAKTHFFNPNNGKFWSINHYYNLSSETTAIKFTGPINKGPHINGYGIAMSHSLMLSLDVHEGEVIYFNIFE